MKNNWLKLYHEILSDPKMGKMTDHLFRRTIELFLLAGQEGKDGILPDIGSIAWSLRTTEDDIQNVISELIKLDMISESQTNEKTQSDMNYLIVNFEKRQKSDKTKSEINHDYYQSQKRKSEIQKNSENDRSENKTPEKIREDKNQNRGDEIREDIPAADVASSQLATPKKQKFGNFKHVLLADEEYKKLSNEFPDVDARIQNLDDYLENNRKKHYDNHYLTIRKWAKKEENANIQLQLINSASQKKSFREESDEVAMEMLPENGYLSYCDSEVIDYDDYSKYR